MGPIDQYIRRATLGLPRRQRLDTAAELRVHLNARAASLSSQGLDPAEAEHLAVERMGPVDPLNRALLGHVFTPRLGWLVAAALAVAFGVWLVLNHLFAPAPVVRARQVVPGDLTPLLGDFTGLTVTTPSGTRSLAFGLARGGGDYSTWAVGGLGEYAAGFRPNQRIGLDVTVGFPAAALAPEPCVDGSRSLYVGDGWGWSFRCLPNVTPSGEWLHVGEGAALTFDSWLPLLVYEGPGEESPELVLSIYTSRAPLDYLNLPVPPANR